MDKLFFGIRMNVKIYKVAENNVKFERPPLITDSIDETIVYLLEVDDDLIHIKIDDSSVKIIEKLRKLKKESNNYPILMDYSNYGQELLFRSAENGKDYSANCHDIFKISTYYIFDILNELAFKLTNHTNKGSLNDISSGKVFKNKFDTVDDFLKKINMTSRNT